jgi:outer membrane lipoprotein-sorting protein
MLLKQPKRFLVASLSGFILLFAYVAHAQQDPKAKGILDAMSKKYKENPAFNAKYSYELESPQEGINQKFEGEITVKNDMYHIKTDEQEVFNNGKTVWVYMKDLKEVTIDRFTPDPDELLPGDIPDMYKTGFKYAYIEEVKIDGKLYDVVELNPENRNSSYFKISMTISKEDKTLRSWKIFDKTGRRYTYTLKNYTPLKTIPDTAFMFDVKKYPGVEVIDNR